MLGSQGTLGSQEWCLLTCPDLGIFDFLHPTDSSKDVGMNSRAKEARDAAHQSAHEYVMTGAKILRHLLP